MASRIEDTQTYEEVLTIENKDNIRISFFQIKVKRKLQLFRKYYQILTLSSGAIYIASPSFISNAT